MRRSILFIGLALGALALGPGAASAQKASIQAQVTVLPAPAVPEVRIEPAAEGPGAAPRLWVDGDRAWGVTVEVGPERRPLAMFAGPAGRALSLEAVLRDLGAVPELPVRVVLAPY